LSGRGREFDGFNQRLLNLIPSLKTHHCALGRPGGFCDAASKRGTYFGHIVEHVALDLTDLAGVGATHGKTRHDQGRVYNVVIEYKAEQAATYLFAQAVKTRGRRLLADHAFDLKGVLDHARQLVADWEPGLQLAPSMDAAQKRGIPCKRDGTAVGSNWDSVKNLRYVQAASTDRTSMIAVELAQDKDKQKSACAANGIPVPTGVLVRSLEEAIEALDALTTPVAVNR
jgi:cyanophycin synthetase